MAYIDYAYYTNTFHGQSIPQADFDRLADIASTVIFDMCNPKPVDVDEDSTDFKYAVCYETELICSEGGINAILGMSEQALSTGESLGGYSYSGASSKQPPLKTTDGIPVSSMTVKLLRKIGLMSRLAYARRE